MKSKSMITVVIMMLCITINAQEQSNKTLVAYFSATGTTEKAAKLMGCKSISLGASVSNPFTIASKDFKGRDPEVATGAQPLTSSYSFNLNVTF